VKYINAKPFDYTAKLNAEGTGFAIECSIKILSSQNENALFRVRIKSNSKQRSHLEVDSEPIQVISKPSVLRKKQERELNKLANQRQVQKLKIKEDNQPLPSSPSTFAISTKRSREDEICSALAIIHKQQEAQQSLLEQIIEQRRHEDEIVHQGSPRSPCAEVCEFETAFKNFVYAYNALPEDERPCKIRKVLEEKHENVDMIVDTMWAETFNKKEFKTSATDFTQVLPETTNLFDFDQLLILPIAQ